MLQMALTYIAEQVLSIPARRLRLTHNLHKYITTLKLQNFKTNLKKSIIHNKVSGHF